MINIEKCRNEFENYVNNYDLSNEKIYYKYYHTLRVSNNSRKIALSLNLNDEEVKLAELIGLFHDIGRFEQVKRYDNFNDSVTLDHAELGVSILFDENKIRDYIDDTKYDEIINKAVYIHNKISIPSEYKEEILLHSKIIRDADKLDILDSSSNNIINSLSKEDNVSKEVYDCFINKKLVSWKDVKTELDKVLINLNFVYDLNYPYSYNVLKKEQYMDKIIDALNLKEEENIKVFNEIKTIINNELNKYGG